MTESHTPNTDNQTEDQTSVSTTWVQQDLTPVRPRRAFGSRPSLSIRNQVRSYYSPKPKPQQ